MRRPGARDGESLTLTLLVGSRQTQHNGENSTSRYRSSHGDTPKTAARALGAAGPRGGARGARQGKGPTVSHEPRGAGRLLPKCRPTGTGYKPVPSDACAAVRLPSCFLFLPRANSNPPEGSLAAGRRGGYLDGAPRAPVREGRPGRGAPVRKLGELVLLERTATVLQRLLHPAHGHAAASGPV